jgi:hypothetical protein
MGLIKRGMLVLMGIAMLGALAFFLRYEWLSNQLETEHGMNGQAANAIKHAYAAAQVYHGLRSIGLKPQKAADTVIWLGKANEAGERIYKIFKPDSTQEMMKDFYNNHAGIVVAEMTGGRAMLQTLLQLSAKNGLVTDRAKIPFTPSGQQAGDSPLTQALRWYAQYRLAIEQKIESDLKKSSTTESSALM